MSMRVLERLFLKMSSAWKCVFFCIFSTFRKHVKYIFRYFAYGMSKYPYNKFKVNKWIEMPWNAIEIESILTVFLMNKMENTYVEVVVVVVEVL